jgi:hypothetical protein
VGAAADFIFTLTQLGNIIPRVAVDCVLRFYLLNGEHNDQKININESKPEKPG